MDDGNYFLRDVHSGDEMSQADVVTANEPASDEVVCGDCAGAVRCHG